jgi:hypothetical protein
MTQPLSNHFRGVISSAGATANPFEHALARWGIVKNDVRRESIRRGGLDHNAEVGAAYAEKFPKHSVTVNSAGSSFINKTVFGQEDPNKTARGAKWLEGGGDKTHDNGGPADGADANKVPTVPDLVNQGDTADAGAPDKKDPMKGW